MRKWMVIGLVVAAIIGLLARTLSQPHPKKGSLEWHKKEYREARARLAGENPFGFFRRTWARVINGPPPGLSFEEELALRQKELFHETALVDMGFLGKCEGVLEGPDAGAMLVEIRSKEAHAAYTRVTLRTINPKMFVEVIAPASDLPAWQALIRSGSMRESGK